MFGRKKTEGIRYDAAVEQPAVKTSICTGERVAGFLNKTTRSFRDHTLIRNDAELMEFCRACGVSSEELKHIV